MVPYCFLGSPAITDASDANRTDAIHTENTIQSVGTRIAEASCHQPKPPLIPDGTFWRHCYDPRTARHTIEVDLERWRHQECKGNSRGHIAAMHTFPSKGSKTATDGSERFIVLVHATDGELYALDGKCHHHGTPYSMINIHMIKCGAMPSMGEGHLFSIKYRVSASECAVCCQAVRCGKATSRSSLTALIVSDALSMAA